MPGVVSKVIPARGQANSDTLFEELSSDHTGIDFSNHWTPPPEYEHEWANAFMGSGVCLGDYDGDGLTDVFLSRPFGGNKLYKNLGDLKFKDVSAAAGIDDGRWGTGATFADVNNDGQLDLYVCGYNTPNRLYINQGDGTFIDEAKARGLDFNGASVMLAFADYDNDGDLDAYLLTNRLTPRGDIDYDIKKVNGQWQIPANLVELMGVIVRKKDGEPVVIRTGQFDRLYENDGVGKFKDVTKQAGIIGNDFGLSVTWWDYNGDNFPDIYAANDYWGPDYLYRNNRDGTFTNVSTEAFPHTPWFSMGADVADLNNDGLFDFMASDMASQDHYKQKISMGDMEQNTWFLEQSTPPQYMRNALYLNTGADRFMEIGQLTGLHATEWTWSIKFADFDQDGMVDAFVSNGMNRNWNDADVLAKANAVGGLQSEDGRKIWAAAPMLKERNVAFRNKGNLAFERVGKEWGVDHKGVSYGAAVGDLDNDGDLDLIVSNFEEQVSVYRNQSTSGKSLKLKLIGVKSNRFGLGATLTLKTNTGQQVRYLTLARGYMAADEPVVHFGVGDSETIESLTIDWPSGQLQTLTQVKANQTYTITEPETRAEPKVTPEPPATMFVRAPSFPQPEHRDRRTNDFARQPLLPNRMSQLGPGMAWGDVDGDGTEDLFFGGAAGFSGGLWLHKDNKFQWTFQQAFSKDKSAEDMGAVFFDADSDGDQDLYVVSGSYEFERNQPALRDRLYLNDGNGKFERAVDALPEIKDAGSCVVAADFDRDGDLDLFIGGRVVPGRYPTSPNSRLLRNDTAGGDIRFTDVADTLAPGMSTAGMVTSATWSDADNDGWLDLLVTYEWGPVRIWRNKNGRLVDKTRDAGLDKRKGWWNGIAPADIDNDGDIDYVVSNFGLNTKYHASPDHPTLIYFGDLDGSGKERIVEASFEGSICFPVRGKSCSTNAMPGLAKKFPQFKDFAAATLPEIYSDRRLNGATKLEINELRSGVLINDGAAHFEFKPLPRIAQVSPSFGIGTTDFDGDGFVDLVLAQNFYGPQLETGRMAGGVSMLLRGIGNADFEPIWPSQSGLVVPDDAKSITTMDMDGDGWDDFLIGVNNGLSIPMRNRGNKDNRLVRIRLKGSLGNISATGARVQVDRSDGISVVREVRAGGGYLSQSSAIVSIGLGKSASVKNIRVRWPDGQETTHYWEPVDGVMSIEQRQ